MNRSTLLLATLVLAFFGLADALYLAHAALTDTALACGINGLDGCNIVAQSAYSRVFGVPLAVYGMVFYALLFILSAAMRFVEHRWFTRILLVIGVMGFLASVYFIYIQVFFIKALCIYCLGSFVLSFLIFLSASRLHILDKQAPVLP